MSHVSDEASELATQKDRPQTREELVQAVAAHQKVAKATAYVTSLRDQAAKVADPKEQERLMREAFEKEVEIYGNSKYSRGWFQGMAAGSGIGMAAALGVGTVVGTLVGGVVSVPTTALGALVGTGVGAIKGPFIKIGGKEQRWEDAAPEEVVDAVMEQERLQKEQQQQQSDSITVGTEQQSLPQTASPSAKRKPRKLEVRKLPAGDEEVLPELEPTSSPVSRRRQTPRKLQVRSKSQTALLTGEG